MIFHTMLSNPSVYILVKLLELALVVLVWWVVVAHGTGRQQPGH